MAQRRQRLSFIEWPRSKFGASLQAGLVTNKREQIDNWKGVTPVNLRKTLIARTVWLNIHSYLGLFAGALLALLGVTGSVLVVDDQIDLLLHPELAIESDGEASISYVDVAKIVVERYGVRPYYIEAPVESGKYAAYIEKESYGKEEIRIVTVNAQSGGIVSDRPWGGSFVSFVRRMHINLFLGDFGEDVVGSIAILSIASIATGIVLWWPRSGKLWRALVLRWRTYLRAQNYELHRLCGFYVAVILLLIALSGIYLVFPEPYKKVVSVFSGLTDEPGIKVSSQALPGQRPLTLQEVVRVVAEQRPDAHITGYQLPRSKSEMFKVYYLGHSEPTSKYGRSTLWVDQYSGEVIGFRDYDLGSAGDRFVSNQFLIHNGQFFGWPGRVIVFVTGILVLGLYVTGVYLWWTRPRRVTGRTTHVAK